MSTQGPVSVHRLLQFKMVEMGYKVSNQGICAGFIGMWCQAVLVGEQQRFHDRLAILMTLPPNYLSKKVGELRLNFAHKRYGKKNRFFKMTSIQDPVNELIAEIPAFMEGVNFHHESILDPGYLGTVHIKQDFKARSSVVSSEKLDNLGGISEVYSFSGLFSKEDLIKLYHKLEQAAGQLKGKQPFVVPLSNIHHRVAFAWDGENFAFCDINDKNVLLYKSMIIQNAEDFAEKVMYSFKAANETMQASTWDPKYNAIAGYVYCAQVHHNALSIAISEHIEYLSDPKQIDKSIINHQDVFGNTWLHQAYYTDNINMIKALVSAGADICLPNYNNTNMLFAIIQTGSIALFDAIKPAIQKNPDMLNMNDECGNNALHIAVLFKNIIALNALIEIYPNILDLENLLGETALHVAVRINSVGAVTILLLKGAEIDFENNFGDSPYSVAMSMEQINPRIVRIFDLYKKRESIAEIVVEIGKLKENILMQANDAEVLNRFISICNTICATNHPDKLEAIIGDFAEIPIPDMLPQGIQERFAKIQGVLPEHVSPRFKP